MSSVVEVAKDSLSQMLSWYRSATSGKPVGYVLSSAEEAKRTNWVQTAREAAVNAIDYVDASERPQALWLLVQVEQFDAVTTGRAQDAIAAAQSAKLAAKQLQGMNPDSLTAAALALTVERADFIVNKGGKKSAPTWVDELGCGAADFWSPCAGQSNWLWWVIGAAAVLWYGKKKKWF